jgi:hypothetical protein
LDGSESTKMTRASLHRSLSSLHTYQSALGLVRSRRDSWNQGCWSDVWFMTRSAMTRMPRLCADSMNAAQSSSVPDSGSTVRKSLMS